MPLEPKMVKFWPHGCYLKSNGDSSIFSMKDNGTGIGPEFLPALFTKFTTLSYIGTGLGLFISKNIIEAYGSRIGIETNVDAKGVIFYFSLHCQINHPV